MLVQHQPPYTLTRTATQQPPHVQPPHPLLLSVGLPLLHAPVLQSHPAPSYGNLPLHMYAAHSSAASAMTAQVAASSQQHRAGASSPSQKSSGNSSRQEKADVHKEDFVEVEKSNMVMLVRAFGCVFLHARTVCLNNAASPCSCRAADTWVRSSQDSEEVKQTDSVTRPPGCCCLLLSCLPRRAPLAPARRCWPRRWPSLSMCPLPWLTPQHSRRLGMWATTWRQSSSSCCRWGLGSGLG